LLRSSTPRHAPPMLTTAYRTEILSRLALI
jgi:hypothetical protein